MVVFSLPVASRSPSSTRTRQTASVAPSSPRLTRRPRHRVGRGGVVGFREVTEATSRGYRAGRRRPGTLPLGLPDLAREGTPFHGPRRQALAPPSPPLSPQSGWPTRRLRSVPVRHGARHRTVRADRPLTGEAV